MTTHKPILFSTEMVLAILSGQKTQTRRVIKPQPPEGTDYLICGEDGDNALCISIYDDGEFPSADTDPWRKCPYGKDGDSLWVRETFGYAVRGYWTSITKDHFPESKHPDVWKAYYKAGFDGNLIDIDRNQAKPTWKPSIHMPRWASRITLQNIKIRAERIRDISDSDIRADGFKNRNEMKAYCNDEKRGFGWDKNPWVWVVKFDEFKGE